MHHFPDPFDSRHIDIRTKSDAGDVPSEVLAAYGLEGASIARLETGSYNIHFRVESGSGRLDLRHSNRPIDTLNLAYEAELLVHLRSRGFLLAPELVLTRDGESNFWFRNDGWTLFRWMDAADLEPRPQMNSARIEAAARTLAEFHIATGDFRPQARRGDWPIFSKPGEWPERWADRVEKLADHLGEDGDDLREFGRRSAQEISEVDFDQLPQTCCHGDYRPRNMRFANDEVAAVFDLDTAMISTRLFDLGGAVTRFSPLAGTSSVPQTDVESGKLFLQTYHEVSPLTSYEWQVLPVFVRWRLTRDVAIYFDRWWEKVRPAATEIFRGAADALV